MRLNPLTVKVNGLHFIASHSSWLTDKPNDNRRVWSKHVYFIPLFEMVPHTYKKIYKINSRACMNSGVNQIASNKNIKISFTTLNK